MVFPNYSSPEALFITDLLDSTNKDQLTSFTNHTMHLSHIPQCTIQNRNVPISVLNDALWDMEQLQCGICEIGLFILLQQSSQDTQLHFSLLRFCSILQNNILFVYKNLKIIINKYKSYTQGTCSFLPSLHWKLAGYVG